MSKILCFFGMLALLAGSTTASAQCRDPWIAQAYKQVANRPPAGQGEACECNIHLYNNGSWASYNDLVGYVRQYLQSGVRLAYAPLANGNFAVAVLQGNQVAAISVFNNAGNVIAPGGANMVAAGGGNLVAAGGGNVIAPGGANVVAPGGANLVAAGGGNFTGLNANTPGFSFGQARGVLAASERRLPTSGGGSIVIR